MTFEISKADTKVRSEVSVDNITLHIKSNVKVNIAEQFRDDFYNAMKRYAPDTWDRVKDNWDEVFKEVKLDIDALEILIHQCRIF